MAGSNGRGNSRYRRENVRLKKLSEPICQWCWEPIDLGLKFPDPRSWSGDHVEPLATGGALHGPRVPLHLVCNQIRGIQPLPPRPPDVMTEDW